MSKKTIFLLILVLFITLIGASCAKIDELREKEDNGEYSPEGEDENDDEVLPEVEMRLTTFYFPDEEGSFVVPIAIEIPSVEGIARSTLEYMVAGPRSQELLKGTGLKPPFPENTEVLGITIREGMARVDFSKEFFNYPEEEERLIITSLLYTLTEFTTVDRVELQVEGEKVTSMPHGTSIGEILTRDRGINLEVTDGLNDFRKVNKLVVYFNTRLGEGQKHYFVPVTRIVAETDNLALASMKELLAGPRPGHPLYSSIHADTQVLDLAVREELGVVDLSSEILDYRGGGEAAEQLLTQIVLTLTELPEVRQVQVFVDGEPTVLDGGVDISDPHQRPGRINLVD